MTKPMKLENAPGHTWRPRKHGRWELRWQARSDLVARGYMPKSARLWTGTLAELNDVAIKFIQDRCGLLQDEMLVWANGAVHLATEFTGTIESLVNCYQTDPDSPYHRKEFQTRRHYDNLCRRLYLEHGPEQIADIKARQLLRWHEAWSEGGKIAMGHGMVTMLRILVNFGATILDDKDCVNLATLLSGMKFQNTKPRTVHLSYEQATAIIAKAHELGRHSIALAQAFSFEGMLRQKDVIGEWLPTTEPGISEVFTGNSKWLKGLRWSEIDSDLVLRHITSKRKKELILSLRSAPLVMAEFDRIGTIPTSGPVIVNENTERPWTADQFRSVWRKIATLCGVPKNIRNMDSRAGGISESTDAGADLEHVRHAAGHSDIGMTQRYSRNSENKTANVQQLRIVHRDKKTAPER